MVVFPFRWFAPCCSFDLMCCKDIRCNNYLSKKLIVRLAGKAQQIRQKLQSLPPKMA